MKTSDQVKAEKTLKTAIKDHPVRLCIDANRQDKDDCVIRWEKDEPGSIQGMYKGWQAVSDTIDEELSVKVIQDLRGALVSGKDFKGVGGLYHQDKVQNIQDAVKNWKRKENQFAIPKFTEDLKTEIESQIQKDHNNLKIALGTDYDLYELVPLGIDKMGIKGINCGKPQIPERPKLDQPEHDKMESGSKEKIEEQQPKPKVQKKPRVNLSLDLEKIGDTGIDEAQQQKKLQERTGEAVTKLIKNYNDKQREAALLSNDSEENELAPRKTAELKNIVEFVRDINRIHAFDDYNCRTGTLLLNRELIRKGLGMSIVQDPNIFDYKPLKDIEMADGTKYPGLLSEVKQGQANVVLLIDKGVLRDSDKTDKEMHEGIKASNIIDEQAIKKSYLSISSKYTRHLRNQQVIEMLKAKTTIPTPTPRRNSIGGIGQPEEQNITRDRRNHSEGRKM